ncbi:uncharacterized protein LOC124680609 isoform X4 [Lolium rigidum]|uniref:uncharacterized protein LOC124680609 isoform X4 n=1 Tax=Lolium rigidum TaxID=89674 RepID=UPI001F5D3BAC|nr:uncharacterized protein LOC124680609 isoform X4 [Lolium rigidum]
MRLVVLYILVRGIVPKLHKSSAASPIPRVGRRPSSSIPAALILLRPNRAHPRRPRVQAHPRRPRARPVSVAAIKFFSNPWFPPWPLHPELRSCLHQVVVQLTHINNVIVARYASITVEPFHFQHQMQQPDDLLDLMLNGPQPRPSDAAR